MPKLRSPPPPGILDHLLDRYREGRVCAADILELKSWLLSEPDVPDGPWFKRFTKFILVGHGELPKTFLTAKMIPKGREVRYALLENLCRLDLDSQFADSAVALRSPPLNRRLHFRHCCHQFLCTFC